MKDETLQAIGAVVVFLVLLFGSIALLGLLPYYLGKLL